MLVSFRRRCGVITPHQHRCDVILTSHACWVYEQLLLCGIIAHTKSSVVHHRGLSAVGECKPADIQMESSIFVYRLNSFFHFRRICFCSLQKLCIPSDIGKLCRTNLIFLQPVPPHPYPAVLVGSASSVCVLW